MIDPEQLLKLPIESRRFSYTERDTMLYALGVGFGSDPLDNAELRFVYEDRLMAVPTQATTVAWDRSWVQASGIPWPKVVHGEQRIEIMSPLPPAGDIVSSTRVSEVLDKGSGALVRVETRIADARSDAWLCTTTTGFFVRGEGGFSSSLPSRAPRTELPRRAPDVVDDARTFGNQALLYRLSGDRNPHHASLAAALAGGFPRPVLHGLCTYGFACRSVMKSFCDWDPRRLESFDARFTAPVFPNDGLRFAMWKEGGNVLLRGSCPERQVTVLEGAIKLKPTLAV